MSRIIQGIKFPDDATDEEIAEVIGAAAPPAAASPGGAVSRAYRDYVAGPVTKAAGTVLALPMANREGGIDWEKGQTMARFLIPQTVGELGAQVATMGAGGLAAKLGLSPLWSAATRVGGALAGSGAGAAASGEPVPEEMIKAGTGAVGGELLGAGISKWNRSGPGAKTRIANEDAARIAQRLGEADLSPSLARPAVGPSLVSPSGPRTPSADLQALAAGEGAEAISRGKELVTQRLERALGGPGSLNVPEVSPNLVTLREANKGLSEIGEGLRHVDILDPSLRAKLTEPAYARGSEQIRSALDRASPGLATIFEAGQKDASRGLTVLQDVLANQPVWRAGPQGIELHTPALQRMLSTDVNLQALLKKRLGPGGFAGFVDAVTRGAGLGQVDRLGVGEGTIGASLAEVARGGNTGSMSLPYAALRALVPGLGAKYIGAPGRIPGTLTPQARTIVDLLSQDVLRQQPE